MSYFPKFEQQSLLSGIDVYNRPFLLAGAIHKLERLTDIHTGNLKTIKQARPGCVVDLLDHEDMSRVSLELVMPNKAVPKKNRISVLSPLGSSLLGLTKGDISRIDLRGRSRKFRILAIHCKDPETTKTEEPSS